ncbi:MAG: hypothetical protein M3O25_01540 [Actinomycetota bacterium]|nr:hypothetical protein [Actinomycetota bacterium]
MPEKQPPKAHEAPPANMQERMRGVQGWIAEIERKQERLTRIGGIAAILAMLAAGGALALGVINQQDAASKDDVEELTGQVNELGASLEAATEKQLKGLGRRIDAVEQQVATLEQAQAANAQEIATLKTQSANAKGAGSAAGVKPAVPGSVP